MAAHAGLESVVRVKRSHLCTPTPQLAWYYSPDLCGENTSASGLLQLLSGRADGFQSPVLQVALMVESGVSGDGLFLNPSSAC